MYNIIEINNYKNKKDNYDELFHFINDRTNISNKSIKHNLLWNIFYLRKVFNKSENFYKNISKKKSNYIYLIIDNANTKIIGIFTIIIEKYIPIKMCEISFLINKSLLDIDIDTDIQKLLNVENNLLNRIISQFKQDNIQNRSNNLFFTYIDSRETKLNDYIKNNHFILSFTDNLTYKYENNIYFLISDSDSHELNINVKSDEINITINLLLQEYYYLADVLLDSSIASKTTSKILVKNTKTQKQTQIRKLTRKRTIDISDISHKPITKFIYEIDEIQDTNKYDYRVMYLFSIQKILILNELNNINKIIKLHYFKNPKIYNKNIYKFYYSIFYYFLENKSIYTIKNNNILLPFYNIILKYSVHSYIYLYIKNNVKYKILEKYKNKLIISNSYDDIKYFIEFTNNIIYIKHSTMNKDDVKNIKKISNEIKIGNTHSKLSSIINKLYNSDEKYNCIFINTTYANYDYLISNVHMNTKLPFIINTILNALKVLENNGNLIMEFFIGNEITIPAMKKLFTFIIRHFKSYEIFDFNYLNILIIKCEGFKLSQINFNDVEQLLDFAKKEEHNEFTIDDVGNYLIAINDKELAMKEHIDIRKDIKKKVIYDIPFLKYHSSPLTIKFIDEYNDVNVKYNNLIKSIYMKYEKLDTIKEKNEFYNKLFIYKITCLFYYMITYNIIKNNEIEYYIQKSYLGKQDISIPRLDKLFKLSIYENSNSFYNSTTNETTFYLN